MEKLGIQSAFGYPALINRKELLEKYYAELAQHGDLINTGAEIFLTNSDPVITKSVRRKNMFKAILRKIIYAITPHIINDAVTAKAWVRFLESRLNRLLKDSKAPSCGIKK